MSGSITLKGLGMATRCRDRRRGMEPVLGCSDVSASVSSAKRLHHQSGFFFAQSPDRDRFGLTVPVVKKAVALSQGPAQSNSGWVSTRTGQTGDKRLVHDTDPRKRNISESETCLASHKTVALALSEEMEDS